MTITHPGRTFLVPGPRLCSRSAISSVVSRCSWCGCDGTAKTDAGDGSTIGASAGAAALPGLNF